MRTPHSRCNLILNYLPKAHLQIPLHWGPGLQHIWILEGHSSVHNGILPILNMRTPRLRQEKWPAHNISRDSNLVRDLGSFITLVWEFAGWGLSSMLMAPCLQSITSIAVGADGSKVRVRCREAGHSLDGLRVKWCHGTDKGSGATCLCRHNR